jgi:hypothetical protein
MKVLLMYPDRDFDPHQKLHEYVSYQERAVDPRLRMPPHELALIQDLELDTLLYTMASGDEFLFKVAENALLSGLDNEVETILYRQEVLKDCLSNPSLVRQLYDLAVEAIKATQRGWWSLSSHYPSSLLSASIELLETLSRMLRKLRGITEEHADRITSEALIALFTMLREELSDDYLASIQDHLTELRFRKGVLLSAELGESNESTNLVLRQARGKDPNWLERLLGKRTPGYTFYLHERDETGARILSEMKHRGISLVTIALAQSADHVLSFFKALRTELAFYVGCLNLHERLADREVPTCIPTPAPAGERVHHFSELCDVCLSFHMKKKVVGNSADADGKSLVVVTGANQGGKSTFLRSIGLAQLMMQCGMFVGAKAFTAEVCPALFTHYKREEDATMKGGKLDEELSRMSEIADAITPNALLLFNESFAATNEREGSEIARQVVSALLEKRVKVFFVTHLYEFAHSLWDNKMDSALFLRAERQPDGGRTFKLLAGEPLQTSFGLDLYEEIFGGAAERTAPE